ncbi:MAG: hypothetical protein N3A01_02095 [Bacteroidales bacterium]|nr:hypothetical protein [Bacteroidales bacterium]
MNWRINRILLIKTGNYYLTYGLKKLGFSKNNFAGEQDIIERCNLIDGNGKIILNECVDFIIRLL